MNFFSMKTFPVRKTDGTSIMATAFEPLKSNGRTLLISAATGAKQSYYSAFAKYCAEKGYHVYTYDYSGIGLSGGSEVKHSSASYSTWGKEDFPTMVNFVRSQHEHQPLYYVGHSFGGNCLGMSHSASDLAAIVTVASQHGYWGGFEGLQKFIVWFVFSVSMPVLTKIFGYFPSRTHGLGENLPRKVASDWSRVILNKNGMEIIAGSAWNRALEAPMLCLSFADDTFAPKRTVDRFAFESYSATPLQRQHIAPKDVQVKAINHFGFFRKNFQATLWQIPLEWFEQHHGKHSEQERSQSMNTRRA